jgi:hypothetical protein
MDLQNVIDRIVKACKPVSHLGYGPDHNEVVVLYHESLDALDSDKALELAQRKVIAKILEEEI